MATKKEKVKKEPKGDTKKREAKQKDTLSGYLSGSQTILTVEEARAILLASMKGMSDTGDVLAYRALVLDPALRSFDYAAFQALEKPGPPAGW
jgi:hypothetical protein